MKSFKEIIDEYRAITILSHINPDADAIGTSLGLYALLKSYGKRVEIANYSSDIPQHLDFLPNFSKIKSHIDYDDSLVIACDSGSIDRLGFDLKERDILNIDHHQTNNYYGKYNFVDISLCSASQVAYREVRREFSVGADSATCFYTGLLSDTQYFTTSSVNINTFDIALQLMEQGANHYEVTKNLTSRCSLASVRIMAKALDTLELHNNAKIASIKIDDEMILQTGALMSDMVGIVDIARSMATVEVAILLVVQDGKTKVSMRSKTEDISEVAEYFGGGGHVYACGFSLDITNLEEVLDKILKKLIYVE